MSRFSFVHAADLHLDTPFQGVGRVPPHVADALRDASLDAWDALVELVLARGAAALLLAGGLCDDAARGLRAQVRLRAGFERLAERGVRVCVALGDRDPAEVWPTAGDWPAEVTVFPDGEVTCVALRRDGTALATIHGISAARDRRGENLARRFARGAAAGPHVGVLHARTGGGAEEACSPCTIEDLRAGGLEYWALGHGHEHAVLGHGDPWIVYPGTPQGRGTTAAECGAKGAVLVEVDGGAITRVSFEPVDRVRSVRLDFEAAAAGVDAAGVRRALTERVNALRAEHPGRALLVEGHLRDDAPAVRALGQPERREALLRQLRRDAEAWTPFVWWNGLHVAPSAARAAALLRQRDDLAAEIARRRVALTGDPERGTRFLARRFEPLRCIWTADLEPREAAEILDEAEALALDLLAGGDGA